MRVLINHPNFPGQYKHIARILGADPNNQVIFASKPKDIRIPGVKNVFYEPTREPTKGIHSYVVSLERAVLAGQAMWRACNAIKKSGFTPDVILSHPGWGEGMFIKDIFPDVPVLYFMEFYYRSSGADVGFDPNEPLSEDDISRIRIKNATNLFNLEACDWAITPTFWQMIQHPREFYYKFSVLHDGIDTDHIKPQQKNNLVLPNGVSFRQGDEVVTYVARNFEPYRGFPQVMRAIEKITKARPNCHVIVVGNDGVSYGKKAPEGKTYKQIMLEELDIDLNRVHFLGSLSFDQYLSVLQYSKAHIYFTVPFVLSWSMMEAMASGCLLVASGTHPVQEVIEDGKNGFLVDFFSPEDLANKVCSILEANHNFSDIRQAARQTILDRYALNKVLPLHMQLIQDLANGQMPPAAAKRIKEFNPPPTVPFLEGNADLYTRDYDQLYYRRSR